MSSPIHPDSYAQPRVETILVVDDAPENRTLLKHLLHAAGFVVREAGDGCEAIKAMEENPTPDLILLDVMMPCMDGFATHQEILKQPNWRDIPVIFLTALGDNDSKMKAFNHGAVDYLTKPIYRPELLARIRVHLRFRQSYNALVAEHLAQLQSLKEAQAVLMPDPAELPEAAFAVFYAQLKEAGGDFYDVFPSGPDSFDYIVADISGHDLGAALPTAALKALLRQNAALHYDPEESLQLLNRHLQPIFAPGQYATIAYLRLNHITGKALLASAGHIPALLHPEDPNAQGTTVMDVRGDPLGCFDSFSPGVARFRLLPQQRIHLFSDGFIEQFQGREVDRPTGLHNLQTAVAASHSLPRDQATGTIARQIHPDTASATDDLLLLSIERRE